MFIEDKIEIFEDIDLLNNYLSKINLTWFKNPVIVTTCNSKIVLYY